MAEYGREYDLIRWATRTQMGSSELTRDENGHIIWHERFPDNDEWRRVGLVTVALYPDGDRTREPVIANLPVSPDVPLDPYGDPDGYTIDELVQFHLDIDSPPLP